MQLRFVTVFTATLIFAFVALWFTGKDPCANFTVTWVGVLPLIVAGTAMTAAIVFITQPRIPSDGASRPNFVLQQFAWTQAGAARAVAARPRKLQGPLLCSSWWYFHSRCFLSGFFVALSRVWAIYMGARLNGACGRNANMRETECICCKHTCTQRLMHRRPVYNMCQNCGKHVSELYSSIYGSAN